MPLPGLPFLSIAVASVLSFKSSLIVATSEKRVFTPSGEMGHFLLRPTPCPCSRLKVSRSLSTRNCLFMGLPLPLSTGVKIRPSWCPRAQHGAWNTVKLSKHLLGELHLQVDDALRRVTGGASVTGAHGTAGLLPPVPGSRGRKGPQSDKHTETPSYLPGLRCCAARSSHELAAVKASPISPPVVSSRLSCCF